MSEHIDMLEPGGYAGKAGDLAFEREFVALRSELERVRGERDRLLEIYRHVHVSMGRGDDECGACGLDLRNLIHKRMQPPAEPEREG